MIALKAELEGPNLSLHAIALLIMVEVKNGDCSCAVSGLASGRNHGYHTDKHILH